MRPPILLVVLVLLLSGCASSPASPVVQDTGQFKDVQVNVSSTTGAIRGVVVDQAIAPIAQATVSITAAGSNKTTITDSSGRFTFSNLAPGTYFVAASHLLYKKAQQSVEVKVGVAEPPITKIQLEALFTAKPFHEQFKFKGIISCGYAVESGGTGITAPCVTDYSTIACAGGCVPQAHETLVHAQGDNRAFSSQVSQNWQTIVVELIFQSNGQGTSNRMGVLISYYNRTAGDYFASTSGISPVKFRIETGELGPGQQGTPEQIDPAGRNDLLLLGSIAAADGQDAGVGINQDFQVFQTNFYNAKPPADWSFANGDDFPF